MSEESPQLARVSRAVLAARSTVFSDMVAFPQPPAGDTELVDGSPVVRLHDSAADVTVFLRALFDSSHFMPSPAPAELEVVLGILRLAHKYDVLYLYRRGLEHLIEDGFYTMSFDAEPRAPHVVFSSVGTRVTPAKPMAIIAAVSEVGALWLLPWAYYSVSTYVPDEIAAFHAHNQPHVQKCIAARELMFRATLTAQRFLTLDDPCATEFTCSKVRMKKLSQFIDEEKDMSCVDPLGEWTAEKIQALRGAGLCADCCAKAAPRAKAAASAFWDALPGILGLPPWNELHAMKRAAMGEEDTDASMAD